MKELKKILKTIFCAKSEWSPLSANKSHHLYWFVYWLLITELERFEESGIHSDLVQEIVFR
jgi:hypothetical protein